MKESLRASRLAAKAPAAVLAALVAACSGLGTSDPTPTGGSGTSVNAPGPRPATTARLDPTRIDEGDRVVLTGNTPPRATPINSVGALPDNTPIEHLQLVLRRSPELETTLNAHIDALHDPTSPRYHQWLTVTQFADQYGVDKADVAVILGWLRKHGFRIDSVAPSRMFIEFSGTAGEIRETFHTEIDRLVVDGVPHMANMRDPELPAELTKTVVGIHALHDFMPHPMHKDRGSVKRSPTTGAWRMARPSPDLNVPWGGECASNADCSSGTCNVATGVCACTTSSRCSATLSGAAATCSPTTGTCVQCQSNADCFGPATCDLTTNACAQTYYAVGPADFATIYNLNPLFAQGTAGIGQTVVVLEDTFLANTSDVAAFRTAFGLSGYAGTFSQTTVAGAASCTTPGVNGDEGEAALDAEWAGATAPDANIVLAACADGSGTSNTLFGGYLALENLINGASPPAIVSISYGECESGNTAAANIAYSQTYQQAAAEGVSVFVSAGDEGAASCDADKTVATHGVSVSGFASTAYNVAVGGTDLADYYLNQQQGGAGFSTYWSAANTVGTFGSALSYIPEIPWNDSCASKAIYSTPSLALGTFTQAYGTTGFCNSAIGKAYYRTTGAGSGGPSNAATAAGVGWPQPSWQTGVVGLPTKSGGVRNLPDVSLFAANGVFGHFLVYCLTDAAQGGAPCLYSNTDDSFALAAGGTSFASPAMAGIQALINQKMGGAQGNPNYTYYKLAASEQGAKGSARCNATSASSLPQPGCIFNDVTQGDIDVNCRNLNATTPNTSCFGTTGTGSAAVQGALSTSNTAYTSAYAAGTGWDYATGLGTVNAYNLVNAWSQ